MTPRKATKRLTLRKPEQADQNRNRDEDGGDTAALTTGVCIGLIVLLWLMFFGRGESVQFYDIDYYLTPWKPNRTGEPPSRQPVLPSPGGPDGITRL